jgi:hypothetical protein
MIRRDRALSTSSSSSLPFTGSANARNKKNEDFHALFRSIPVTDSFIESLSFSFYLAIACISSHPRCL